jgi:uncharacterized iron-regulated membrane protein
MRKLVFNLHLYVALIAALLIIAFGVTGSIMAFETEIDHLLHWRMAYVTPGGHPLSLGEIGAIVSKAFPGEQISGYAIAPSPDLSYQVFLRRGAAYVNQYTGEVLGTQQGGMDFLGYVHQFHLRLMIRNEADTGKRIMSWAGVAMLFLIVSGLYLWWPYKRFSIERRGSSKRFWFDIHAVTGIFSFVFLFALAATGVIIGFEQTTTPVLFRLTGSRPSRPPRIQLMPPAGAQPITPDQAIEIARKAFPGAEPFIVNVPASGEPYFIAARYPEDLTPGGRSRIMIDPYTGKVLYALGSRTVPGGTRLVNLNRSIHTGDVFGIPSKAILSLASLMAVVQVISGLVMWWKGRRARERARGANV